MGVGWELTRYTSAPACTIFSEPATNGPQNWLEVCLKSIYGLLIHYTSTLRIFLLATNGNSFIGCISRVQFNGIDPIKLYFGATRPQGVAGSGLISQSRCGIEEQIPMFLPTEEYPPTEPPMVTQFIPSAAPVSSDLAPGDKAAIASKNLELYSILYAD